MVREEFERAGGVQFVVEREGELAGFAFGWLIVGELHVLHIATLPTHRRAGVGRALLRRLLACQVDSPLAWLEVRADNTAALQLYRVEGFEEVGRRPFYYTDRTAAVVMTRRG